MCAKGQVVVPGAKNRIYLSVNSCFTYTTAVDILEWMVEGVVVSVVRTRLH
jgi:hypothetical protein